MTWSSEYKITNAQSDDDGAANTAAITTAFPNDNGSNNAAWLCRNYDKEKGNVGFTDWYLPAKNELNKMYLYARANNLIGRNCTGKRNGVIQCLVGGYYERDMYYWSSTEYSGLYSGGVWSQVFSYGNQYSFNGKIFFYSGVRAIRAFNNIQQLRVRKIT